VTPGDAQLAFQIYIDCWSMAPTSEQYCAADFCGTGQIDICDGSVTPADAQGIMRFYLGYPAPCSKEEARATGITGFVYQSSQPRSIHVAVRLDKVDGPMSAWGLRVYYDASKVEYLGFSPGQLDVEWAEFRAAASEPGVVVAGAYSMSEAPAGSSGLLLKLTFGQKLPSEVPLTSLFKIDDLVDDLSGATARVAEPDGTFAE